MTQFTGSNAIAEIISPTIRVDEKPALPMDPIKIQTMADYDLQLCLYRTWFEYDPARKAKAGIISDWNFDVKRGVYRFTVSSDSKWSDGSPILPIHLIKNLQRAAILKTSYGEAIQSIIKLESAKQLDATHFELETQNHQSSEQFFQRMGSSFLAPVHPDDWDENFRLKDNRLTSGPYRIKTSDSQGLLLESNQYDNISLNTRPESVEIHFQPMTDLALFVEGKTRANVMQSSTLMPIDLAEKVKDRKLPFWTRGHDRVSKLIPLGKEGSLEIRRKIALGLGAVWADLPIGPTPFNAKKATSLQPPGYPLLTEIDFRPFLKNFSAPKKTIKIVAQKTPQNEYQTPLLEMAFQKIGIQVNWIWGNSFVEINNLIAKNSDIDFWLASVGVADPEPTTWMALVINEGSPFVETTSADVLAFKKIAKLSSKEEEVKGFQSLLREIALRGSYVPLFHFSSLSLGQPGISFENIRELDETVDYSKLIIK